MSSQDQMNKHAVLKQSGDSKLVVGDVTYEQETRDKDNALKAFAQVQADQLKGIELEIKRHLGDVMHSMYEIGRCMTEAQSLFDGQKSFGKWTEGTFGIKVRMANRYIQVFKKFGNVTDMTRFQGVALEPLSMIASKSDEVIDLAASFIQHEGKFSYKDAKELLDSLKPAPEKKAGKAATLETGTPASLQPATGAQDEPAEDTEADQSSLDNVLSAIKDDITGTADTAQPEQDEQSQINLLRAQVKELAGQLADKTEYIKLLESENAELSEENAKLSSLLDSPAYAKAV